jgi:hypothetical protein
VKVEVLVEWCLCFHGSDAFRLPTLGKIPSFLNFVAAVLHQRGNCSTRTVIQEQYLINDNLKDRQLFDGFFRHLQRGLPLWLSRQVHRNIGDSGDLFGETNQLLTKFINSGIVDSYNKQPFHTQHMLLNFNEVVAQFPFGEPVTPAHGGIWWKFWGPVAARQGVQVQ